MVAIPYLAALLAAWLLYRATPAHRARWRHPRAMALLALALLAAAALGLQKLGLEPSGSVFRVLVVAMLGCTLWPAIAGLRTAGARP